MRIQYCSDLHLEFKENKEFLDTNPIQPSGEVLLLAGDIVPFILIDKHKDFFDFISNNFETTYWVPGNHEYYYYDAAKKCGTFNEQIRHNIFLVNNTIITHSKVNFIFSTLWSKISERNEWNVEQSVSDFQVIKFNDYRLGATQFNQLHQQSVSFLKETQHLHNSNKTVIVTHHVPTLLNYPAQYKGSAINEAFAVELHELIEDMKADYWIYGHHHINTPEFTIGKTKMLTNQLGYVRNGENRGFEMKII